MIIEIPGYKTLDLDYLVLDYNGTIAVDGLIPPAIKERLLLLGDSKSGCSCSEIHLKSMY